jgi:hypothetical protein
MDSSTLILAIAIVLFIIAVAALFVRAFKTFVFTKSSKSSFLRPRERRLGVVETASVDGKRKLLLSGATMSSTF